MTEYKGTRLQVYLAVANKLNDLRIELVCLCSELVDYGEYGSSQLVLQSIENLEKVRGHIIESTMD